MMSFKDKFLKAVGLKKDPLSQIVQKIAEGEKLRLEREAQKGEGVCCDYCNKQAELVTGAYVYPHRPDLADLKFYICEPCDARVGCHKDTGEPYGRLADAELRHAKMDAHEFFDNLWKGGGVTMSRDEAYRWLAEFLDIPREEAYIGKFDVETCHRIIDELKHW